MFAPSWRVPARDRSEENSRTGQAPWCRVPPGGGRAATGRGKVSQGEGAGAPSLPLLLC